MDWSFTDARARFTELLRDAEHEPQFVSRHGRRVAVIVSADEFEAFEEWRRAAPHRSLADALDDVQRACTDESWSLETGARADRANPFSDAG